MLVYEVHRTWPFINIGFIRETENAYLAFIVMITGFLKVFGINEDITLLTTIITP